MSADVGFNDYPRVVSLSSTIGAGAAYPHPTWSKPHRQVRCIVRNSQQIAPKLGPSRQLLQNRHYAQNPSMSEMACFRHLRIAAVPSFCLPEPLRVDENEDPTGVEDYIAQ
jgi:hypothetical protein